jgi:hypothetical protein
MEKYLFELGYENTEKEYNKIFLYADSLRAAVFQVEVNNIKDLHPKSNKPIGSCEFVFMVQIVPNHYLDSINH